MKYPAVLILAAASCFAGTISTLHNTGETAPGSQDPNWTVNGNPTYVTQDGAFPFMYWIPNGPLSKWISPQQTYQSDQADEPGNYTYSQSFDLTGYDLSTVNISIAAASDNRLISLFLNGLVVYTFGTVQEFTFQPAVVLSSGFLAGANRLDFLTYNKPNPDGDPNIRNPSGLQVVFDSHGDLLLGNPNGPSVPEPATAGLICIGLLSLVLKRTRVKTLVQEEKLHLNKIPL